MKKIDVSSMYTRNNSDTEFLPKVSSRERGLKKLVKIFFIFFISFCIFTVDRFIKYSQVLIFPKDMISANYKRS